MNFAQDMRQFGLKLACSFIFYFSVGAGASDVYSWTDANGVLHFSDRPPQEASTSLQIVPLPRNLNKASLSERGEVVRQQGTEHQEKSAKEESQKPKEENTVSSNQDSQEAKTPEPPLTRSQRLEQKKERRSEVMRSRFTRTKSPISEEASPKSEATSAGQNPPQESPSSEQTSSKKEEKPSFDWNDL